MPSSSVDTERLGAIDEAVNMAMEENVLDVATRMEAVVRAVAEITTAPGGAFNTWIAEAREIVAVLPDPDIEIARRFVADAFRAEKADRLVAEVERGERDDSPIMQAALAAYKSGKAAR